MSSARVPKRIVLVTLGALGDALMVASAADAASVHVEKVAILATKNIDTIRTLVRGNARISVLSTSPVSLSYLLAGGPTVICFPPTFGTLPKTLKTLAAILNRIPLIHTVGFRDKATRQPYTHTLQFNTSKPFIENLKEQLVAAGVPITHLVPHPVFTPASEELSERSILIHPFAANLKRSLPPRRWQSLMKELENAYPHHTFYVSAFGSEAELAREWFRGTRVTFLIDRPIEHIAGYLTQVDAYIGVDTGITHLAGVLQVPSVVIGNRSNPTWLPHYNSHARILTNDTRCTCTGDKGGDCTVYEDGKPYYRCLYDTDNTQILAAVREIVPIENDD